MCIRDRIVAELGGQLRQLLLDSVEALLGLALESDAAEHKVPQLVLDDASLGSRQARPLAAGAFEGAEGLRCGRRDGGVDLAQSMP